MKPSCVAGILFSLHLTGLSQELPPITVWAPGAYATNPGNALRSAPFVDHISPVSHRYQQVFAAAEFAETPQGGYITGMTFRQRGDGRFHGNSSRFQVNMSTTQAIPDGLSSVFLENVGPDDKIVFGPGRLNFQGAEGYDDTPTILLEVPFFYNPTHGNLLLDMRNFSGNDLYLNPFTTLGGDSVGFFGDSISTVQEDDVNALSGRLSTTGYIVGFQIQPLPEPGTMTLLALGLSTLVLIGGRRQRS